MLRNKINFSYEFTTKTKNATKIAKKAVEERYGVVVSCGGDGTVREVINGLAGSNTTLGLIPFGTSNDFAKHLKLDKIEKAKKALFSGKRIKLDLGLVEFSNKKLYYCSTSGIGFDARLLQFNEKKYFLSIKKIIGNFAYILFSFFLLFTFKPAHVTIKFNDKKIKLRLFMINVNFVKQMSGVKITPNADVNNGVFDIFLSEQANLFKKIFTLFWYKLTSRKLNFKEINYISKDNLGENKFGLKNVKSFSVDSEEKIPIQLNGDFVGFTPVKFKILPSCLGVMVGKGN